MQGKILGRIHSEESAGTVDGPGLRYVIFMQGCPLRCQFCHNPDTWNLNGGYMMSVDDMLANILKYKEFMSFSGGGVTVSGGDPILHLEFVTELFIKLRENGIHTALDTSGYVLGSKELDRLLQNTDLVLLDIKHLDTIKHKSLTGFDNLKILNFLQHLEDMKVKTWVRYVIIPTISDDLDYANQLGDYVKKFSNVECLELLPYHEMGKYKWQELGLKYKLDHISPPEPKVVKEIAKIIKSKGLKVLGF